jgi:myosin heavy subunit
MADINLNIGSDDLDKLKKLLAEIQKAADKLTKTIQKAGAVTDNDVTKAKRLAAEHKKIENAIKREEIAAQRLASQQDRVNQKTKEAQGIIGNLEAQARQFRSAMKSAQTEAEMKRAQAGLSEVQSKLQQAKGTTASWSKALGSFQFKFNSLGNIAANVLSKITQGLKEAIKDSIDLALQAEGVEMAFKRIATPGLLKNLRDATKGTVTDLELMRKAVMASNFKIPLDQLAFLFEFAAKRAQDTGESVDFLVNSIVTGLGRKSVLILDNLGVSAIDLRAKLEGVGTESASVAQLVKAFGEIAQEEMQKAGDIAETAAVQVSQLRAEWLNFKEELGGEILKTLNEVSKVNFAGNLSAFQLLNDALEEGSQETREYGMNMDELFQTVNGFNFQQSGLWAMALAIGDMDEAIEKLPAVIQSLSEEDQELLPWMSAEGFDAAAKLYAERNDKVFKNTESEYQAHLDMLQAMNNQMLDEQLEKTEDTEGAKLAIFQHTLSRMSALTSALTRIILANKEKELSAAGDNAKKREEIEIEFAKKEQQLAIATALINGAIGIT